MMYAFFFAALGSCFGGMSALKGIHDRFHDEEDFSLLRMFGPILFWLALGFAGTGGGWWLNRTLTSTFPADTHPAGVITSTESHPDGGLLGPAASTTVHTPDTVYQVSGLVPWPEGAKVAWGEVRYWGETRAKLCLADRSSCASILD